MIEIFFALIIYFLLVIENFMTFRRIAKLQGNDAMVYYEGNRFVVYLMKKYGLFLSMAITFMLFVGVIVFIYFLPYGVYLIWFASGYFFSNFTHDLEVARQILRRLKELKASYVV